MIDISAEAIEEVYVGFNTPRTEIAKMEQVVGVGRRRMEVEAHRFTCLSDASDFHIYSQSKKVR